MRKNILKIYAGIFAVGIPYYLLVTFTDFGIPCIIYETTGFLCGGCGVSRMLISMAKIQFIEAFGYNMIMFVLFFVWNGIALFAFIGKPSFVRNSRFLYNTVWVSVVALTIFAIVRNFT